MPKKPLWKLSDGVTYSSLSTWVDCPEQFSLQWIDGLTPKKLSEPLEFGSVMHYAIEHQDKGRPEEVIHRITTHYKKYRGKTLVNTKEKDALNTLLDLAEVVFPEYCKYWSDDDAALQWVGKEEKFSVPYTLPTPQGNRELTLRGMRDGLYRAKNTFGLFETKTKGQISDNTIMDSLHRDMQTMMYLFATYLELGEYANEIKYNVIRRPGLYRRKGEESVAYVRRCKEDIISRPDFYFRRYRVTILQEDITKFVKETLNPTLVLFVQWWDSIKKNPLKRFESPYHHLNSIALVGRYGKSRMWDAVHNNFSPYYVRDTIYPELAESFQVTWDNTQSQVS